MRQMTRLKFFLHNPSDKKETPIFLSITYSSKRVKLKTKQKAKPKAWNKTSNSIRKSYTEYQDVQEELDRIEAVVKRIISDLIKIQKSLPPPKELKRILEAKVFSEEIQTFTTFWEYFDHYIEELNNKKNPRTGKPITKSTIDTYIQTKDTLIGFESHTGKMISFNTLSNSTYDNIILYLKKEKKFSPNTIGKHIKNLKAVINSANHDGYLSSGDYKEKYWKVYKHIKTASEIVALTEDELKELWEKDLSKNLIQEKARDLFLIGAWTALRISDVLSLKEENFDFDRNTINLQIKKTGSQLAIPLHPVVKEIFKKYDGVLPRLQEPTINKEIKKVCADIESLKKEVSIEETKGNVQEVKTYKKYDRVTTHSARRSFASNMFRRNIPVHQIMAITDHKKEADFFRYIGVTNDEIAQSFSKMFDDWYSK